jgi:hypothetical protein
MSIAKATTCATRTSTLTWVLRITTTTQRHRDEDEHNRQHDKKEHREPSHLAAQSTVQTIVPDSVACVDTLVVPDTVYHLRWTKQEVLQRHCTKRSRRFPSEVGRTRFDRSSNQFPHHQSLSTVQHEHANGLYGVTLAQIVAARVHSRSSLYRTLSSMAPARNVNL